MTWTPENNTTIWALLTDEQKEALKAYVQGKVDEALEVAVENAFKEGWKAALWGPWTPGSDHSAWLKSAALAEIKGENRD